MMESMRATLCVAMFLVGQAACQGTANYEEPPIRIGPNIVLLMSDDQGWGDVSYNGNDVLETPHLDAMAAEGVRLDRLL